MLIGWVIVYPVSLVIRYFYLAPPKHINIFPLNPVSIIIAKFHHFYVYLLCILKCQEE